MTENNMPLGSIISLTGCNIYQQDHLILSNINLNIDRGEFVYLIGKVGSGKTTLIKTLNGQIPLREGEALVAGFNLALLKRKEIPKLRRNLGIVFQDFQLLSDRTVYSNLEFVLKATGWKNRSEIDERIAEVLDKVGLGTKGYKMPHQLSGGEQQRVVISRALLNDPDIILADEPTGNLDPETSDTIINILKDISKSGRAVVVATHNYTLLKKHVARTIKCEDGTISEANHDQELEFIN